MEKRLSDGAEALFHEAAFNSFTSGRRDGFIADSLLSEIDDADNEFIAQLLEAQRWEAVPGGYQIVSLYILEELARRHGIADHIS